MNRVKRQPFIIQIDKLDKRIARWMLCENCFGAWTPRIRRFRLFPDSLGSRKRVIAIAHCKKKHFVLSIFRPEGFWICQAFEGFRNARELVFLAHQPTAHMPRIFHEVEIVGALEILTPFIHRLDHRSGRIINKNHNVRKLERGSSAYGHARRQALDNRSFCWPN